MIPMPGDVRDWSGKNSTIPIAVLIGIFVVSGCVAGYLRYQFSEDSEDHGPGPAAGYPEGFFPVTGRVDGNPFPNSSIYLYEVPNTNRTVVLQTIRNSSPIREVSLNAIREFKMDCIAPGDYALVLPDTSFDGPLGAPTPEEWVRHNYSLNISLLGYDFDFLVGAFSITRVYDEQDMVETAEETKE